MCFPQLLFEKLDKIFPHSKLEHNNVFIGACRSGTVFCILIIDVNCLFTQFSNTFVAFAFECHITTLKSLQGNVTCNLVSVRINFHSV